MNADDADTGATRRRRSFRRRLIAGLALAVVCIFIAASQFAPPSAPDRIIEISLSPTRRQVAFVTESVNFPENKTAQEALLLAAEIADFLGADELPWFGFECDLRFASTSANGLNTARHSVDTGACNIGWSPDESWIFYAKYVDKRPCLFKVERDERSVARIGPLPGQLFGPLPPYTSFSPCGRYVACTDSTLNTGELWLLDLKSGESSLPSKSLGWFGRPCWNADGSKIYCCRTKVQSDLISLVGVDVMQGSEETLCSFETNVFKGLDGSPDRKQLGYVSDNAFYTIDLSSREITKQFECTVVEFFVQQPFDWSESGVCFLEPIATPGESFSQTRYGIEHSQLLVNRLDGRPSEVIAMGLFGVARWLTDDTILVLANINELWKYSVSTKRGERLFP